MKKGIFLSETSDHTSEKYGWLTVMEERISAISAIADRNLQNAGETEQSSGSLAKEAEALQAQVQKFILKEKRGG